MADSIYANPSPVTPNDFDGGSHAWGMKFTVSDDATCAGGRAWVPAAGRPTTFLWQLWRVGDSTKIAESDLNAVGHGTPSSGAWYSFDSTLFATPGDVALSSAETYRVCVAFQGGDGVYTDDGSETFPTGTGVVSSATGSFNNGGGTDVMPGTDYLAWFFADVTVESGGATHEGEGTTAATGAASATATVDRIAAGTAAATGASSATATADREAAGTAAATGGSSAAAAVDREASGAAAAAGTATASAAVTRQAAGTAAATATASATATVDPGGIPITPAAWSAGSPELKWHAGPPESKWHAGPPEVG